MPSPRSNTTLAVNLALVAAGMLGLAYASVPLYRLFCDFTGYGGTTRQAAASAQVLGRAITVTFNAETDPSLPWQFHPSKPGILTRIGENTLTHYVAENNSNQPVTGRATYNVTPFAAGRYFTKIECFCFTEQTLKPHQRVEMPVLFYIDPSFAADPELKTATTITLSYTFFPVNTDTNKKP